MNRSESLRWNDGGEARPERDEWSAAERRMIYADLDLDAKDEGTPPTGQDEGYTFWSELGG